MREAVVNIFIVPWPQFELHHAIKILLFIIKSLRLEVIADINNIVRP